MTARVLVGTGWLRPRFVASWLLLAASCARAPEPAQPAVAPQGGVTSAASASVLESATPASETVALSPRADAPAEAKAEGLQMRKLSSGDKRRSAASSPTPAFKSAPAGGAAMKYRGAPAPTTNKAFDEPNTENYAHVAEGRFINVAEEPLSTFSVDVDTASYSNSRRFIADGSLPPADAIRVEEWVNYFRYDYQQPTSDAPFAVNSEVSACPWNDAHRIVRIGVKGREIAPKEVPARNLVFLLDVSGSMMSPDKLPLVKRGLALLTDSIRPQDSISIVVYAGNSGMVLPPTSDRTKILSALERLEAGGSTNGGAGIQLAYSVALEQFRKNGINRVILATDGDFNVGTSSEGELQRLIEDKRKTGVFLTVLGFGTGNIKDSTMELLADKGNGNYAYVDSLAEARKVLVREAGSTLVTIAKDVKLQVEFNPKRVASYKLIGYENRVLAKQDFNDDKKDAGEIGAGHSVTALYEIVPRGAAAIAPAPAVDPLKYQDKPAANVAADAAELMTVNIRYKAPSSDTSTKLSVVVRDTVTSLDRASTDFRFGVAVANAALLLRGSPDVKRSDFSSVRALAAGSLGADLHGDRREFLALVDRAAELKKVR